MTDQNYIDVTDPKWPAAKYRVYRTTGEVFTWIERQKKASGWQKLKSAPRIKRITKLAIAAYTAQCKADQK